MKIKKVYLGTHQIRPETRPETSGYYFFSDWIRKGTDSNPKQTKTSNTVILQCLNDRKTGKLRVATSSWVGTLDIDTWTVTTIQSVTCQNVDQFISYGKNYIIYRRESNGYIYVFDRTSWSFIANYTPTSWSYTNTFVQPTPYDVDTQYITRWSWDARPQWIDLVNNTQTNFSNTNYKTVVASYNKAFIIIENWTRVTEIFDDYNQSTSVWNAIQTTHWLIALQDTYYIDSINSSDPMRWIEMICWSRSQTYTFKLDLLNKTITSVTPNTWKICWCVKYDSTKYIWYNTTNFVTYLEDWTVTTWAWWMARNVTSDGNIVTSSWIYDLSWTAIYSWSINWSYHTNPHS